MANQLEQIYSDGFVSLDHIVQNAIFEGGYDDIDYDRILYFVTKAFKSLNIFHFVNKKTVKLTVNSINCVDLPQDYVDYLKIGVVGSNGLFWTFTKNDAISTYKDFDCGVEVTPESTETTTVAGTTDYTEADKKVNVLYNYTGGNNNQYFKVDKENNRIVLKNDAIGTTVTLEYITTGINTTSETIVPVMFNDTLVSFALWQMKFKTPRTPLNEIMLYKDEWIRNSNILKRAVDGFTKEEFLDVMFKSYKRTLKVSA